jgi:ribosome-associated translation inhibitor RaiA
MTNRPLTEREVRAMFAAIDKAEDDRLERQLERERKADAWEVRREGLVLYPTEAV